MTRSERELLLHLSLIDGVGPVVGKRLYEAAYPDGFAALPMYSAKLIAQSTGISLELATKVVQGLSDEKEYNAEIALLSQNPLIHYVTIADEEYPALLREIYAPPLVLYYVGALPAPCQQLVSFVGARHANYYGKQAVNHLIPPCIQAGVGIVSGGAVGVDTWAHQAALDAGGYTIAIIGSGLLRPYPSANKKLFNAIVEKGGCVISPFQLNAEPRPYHFPARNRIISGIAATTVVVQAKVKSGTRSTALHALEQGRSVCVVPGSIFEPLSEGCHALLKDGATPVTSADDVLATLGHVSYPAKEVQGEEDSLLAACKEPVSFDDLLAALGCSYADLQERLFEYQLQGLIQQDLLGRWVKV